MTSPLPPSTSASLHSTARSEVYLFLARAFMYPQEPLDDLYQRACAALAILAGEQGSQEAEERRSRGAEERRGRGARENSPLPLCPEPPGKEQLEALYQATFTHTTPGEFPPYETQYGQGHIFRQPQALAELAALYRAFGLQPAGGERLDHIGTEMEFMYFLCYKEAFALLSGNAEGAERCREGQRHFLERHVGRWAPLFLARLSRQADGFYAHLASLAGAWLAQEAEGLEARLSPVEEEALLAAQRLERFFDRLEQTAAACEEEGL